MDINKRFGIKRKSTISRLITTLTNSKIATENNSLYQTIFGLIKNVGDFQEDTNNSIETIQTSISGGSGSGGGGIVAGSFVTMNNEQFLFPTSRQIAAGTNITLIDNGIQIIINSASIVDHVVMSDGGIPDALPLNDGAGNFIYIPYVP